MTHQNIDRARGWIAWVGVALGIVAILISLRVNQLGNERTANTLKSFQTSSCEREHKAADQWDSVLAVLTDISERNRPGSSKTASFQELVTKTHKIYSVFPACKSP